MLSGQACENTPWSRSEQHYMRCQVSNLSYLARMIPRGGDGRHPRHSRCAAGIMIIGSLLLLSERHSHFHLHEETER